MKILLVEPNFPIPKKSKNHSNFLPIGLLKLATYYRNNGNSILLVRGNRNINFEPNKILITSLFTYWSKYVWESVQFYKSRYPKAEVAVGGIYATLMPKHCKQSGCDKVFIGLHKRAEKYQPAYDLVNVDYQIVHTMRGCIRKCNYCGVWKLEPKQQYKKSIRKEILKAKIIFYDNNFLANPYVKDILKEIINLRYNGKSIICESQSGFDGTLLNQELAYLLNKARFINPRIAWDGSYSAYRKIKRQIEMLTKAGYKSKDIYVFMLYNFELSFEELQRKRLKCWEWQVQIADCRFRPLNQIDDRFNSRKPQTSQQYYIHSPVWTDSLIKKFRKNVRRQNICVRHGFPFYSKTLENKRISKEEALHLKTLPKNMVKKFIPDVWFPYELLHETKGV